MLKKENIQKIVLDKFCFRQWDKNKTSFPINYDKEELTKIINDHYLSNKSTCLVNGYAPFCKHIFLPNFTEMFPNYIKIEENNEHLIKTCYEARTEKELPVLRRYIPYDSVKSKLNKAKYLDIILYSKEQILKEDEAMQENNNEKNLDFDYGIISIRAQDESRELPMDPITMMRNALGIEHGGSGVELDKSKYLESVKFWSENILLK